MTRVSRLIVVLVPNLALIAALIVVGVTAHSLAVLAEGADYCWTPRAWERRSSPSGCPRGPRRHPGARKHANAGVLAALVNAGWLLLLELLVVAGAVDRPVTGVPAVRGLPVLILSAVAAILMTASVLVLGGDADDADEGGDDEERGHRLSAQAILLDAGADDAAAAGVAVAGAIIWAAHGIYWLDPAVARWSR